jgi:hypothetical protein
MELYLHIGAPKCGSTTIQRFLGRNEEQLARSGICLLESFGKVNAWKIAAASGTEAAKSYWVDLRRLLTTEEYVLHVEKFWQEVESEVSKKNCKSVLASSEYIYGQYGRDYCAIKRLRENFAKIFAKVTIIFYFRNQVAFTKSLYAQRVKGPTGATESYEAYISSLPLYDDLIDFWGTLSIWANVFGEENIRAGIVDRGLLYQGDLVSDFLRKLGVDGGEITGFEQVMKSANVSPSYTVLNYCRLLNVLEDKKMLSRRASYTLKRLLACRVTAGFGNDFPRQFDQHIADRYSENYLRLCQKFLPPI